MIEVEISFRGRTIRYRADTDDPEEGRRRAGEYVDVLERRCDDRGLVPYDDGMILRTTNGSGS